MEQHIRRLRLNHVANVRDLGGYEADGGMIRWNMLYRAGDLSGAAGPASPEVPKRCAGPGSF